MKMVYAISAVGLASILLLVGCHRGGWHKKDHTDKILKHIDKRVSRLDLNTEQNTKYQEIRARLKADLHAQFKTRSEAMSFAKSEIQKENPDIRAVADNMKTKLEARSQAMSKLPNYFVEVYEILDEAQKKKVIEKLRDKAEHF